MRSAASFFDILREFDANGELGADVRDIAKYAKWKAADIMKALSEGRKPTPGDANGSVAVGEGFVPDDGEDAHHVHVAAPVAGHDDDDVPMAHPPPALPAKAAPAPAAVVAPPPRAPSSGSAAPDAARRPSLLHPVTSSSSVRVPLPGGSGSGSRGAPLKTLPRARREDALEFIKFARAAVEADEVELAVQRLESALALMYE